MYDRLKQKDDEPQIDILRRDGYFELVLLTLDCPGLFSHVVGTLSSWGMNILKAEAFSNKAGVVLDTFRFSDRFRTLELNPSEIDRLKRKLAEAVSGEIDVVELMETKFKPGVQSPKITVEPSVQIDNECSQHSTLIEIIAQDRPGLLYDISSAMAELGCNIEVAIIDTQGQTATDVFHVTCAGAKLDLRTPGEDAGRAPADSCSSPDLRRGAGVIAGCPQGILPFQRRAATGRRPTAAGTAALRD